MPTANEQKSERVVMNVLQLTPSDAAFISMVLEMYAVEMERSSLKVNPTNVVAQQLIARDIADAKRLMEIL